MLQRSTTHNRPIAFPAGLMALILAGASALAGEKMVELPPSKPGNKMAPAVKPIDPVLDHILNSGKIDSGFNPGSSSPVPTTPAPSQGIDPALQKRWGLALEKRRNWLLENAAVIGASESGAFKASDDLPRFSQPGSAATKPGFGDRYLRATQTANTERSTGNPANTVEIDPTTGQPRNSLDGIGGNASGALDGGPGNLAPTLAPIGRIGASAFAEQGRFTSPAQAQLDLNRRGATAERAAIFDRLLSGTAAPASGSLTDNASASGPFNLTRTPVSRAQQFQNLLAGPEPQKVPSPTAFGSSAFGNSAGLASAPGTSPSRSVLPGLNGLGDRTLSPSAIPGSAPTVTRPPAPKFEPRPALLPIPTRGF